MMKNRVGVGDEVAGLDSASLANINTGVIAQAYDMARMRIELMARIFGEVGLKPLFQDIHRLLHKNQAKSVQWKMGGQWIDVDPAHWREDRDCKVNVGLGHNSREKKILATNDILMLQEKAATMGLYYSPPEDYKLIHNALSERIEAHGMDINKFFPAPERYQPKQQQPNPEIEFKKAELQLQAQKIQSDMQKSEMENQVKMMLAQSREREMAMKAEMENLKGFQQIQRMKIDEQNQVMRAMTDQSRAEFEKVIQTRQQQWKEYSEGIELELERQKNMTEKYKADLQSTTDLTEKTMETQQKQEADFMKHMREMMQMLQNAENDRMERQAKITDWIEQNGSDRIKSFAKSLH
jgi:hypothetical protein